MQLSNRVLTFDFPFQVGEAKGTLHNFILENFVAHEQVCLCKIVIDYI